MCKAHSLILVVVVTRIYGWTLFTADVSTAFLQGRESDRQLWVTLPKEACDLLDFPMDTKLRLLKSM